MESRAKRIGLLHGAGNVVIVAIFSLVWLMRRGDASNPGTAALTLEIVARVGALLTGWLGGELVDRLGVGVDRGSHLDAPSSLSGIPAHGQDASGRGLRQ